MIKLTTYILILCCLIISCGKKGDPKYKNPDKEAQIQTILINKI